MKYLLYILLMAIAFPCPSISQGIAGQENADMGQSRKIRRELLDIKTKKVFVVSHRANWRCAPENSIPAIKNSIRLHADVVELDARKTKDGHIILMHDETLDRTTTGNGRVDEWTLDAIKTLYLKNGADLKTKYRVPTLEEALLTTKGRILVNLDKSYDIIDEIYPILEKTGTVDEVILKGDKSAEVVQNDFGRYLKKILYMPIIHLDSPGSMKQIDDFMNKLHPVAFELLFVSDTCKAAFAARKKLEGKSRIWYNTLWDTLAGGHDDDLSLEYPDKGYGYLIDSLGASIIQTDRTIYLLDYLKKRHLNY